MKAPLVLLLAMLGSAVGLAPAMAHGVNLQQQTVNSIEIQARYDSGELMKDAQVTVYAPNDPKQPWLQGTTDAAGRFVFTPDATQPGNWEVMVRQAGHGGTISIPVGAGPSGGSEVTGATGNPGATATTASLAKQPGELSPVQYWVTIAAVIWGFIGTALFFARGKR